MKVIKHGNIIIFNCPECDCSFAVTRKECLENDRSASVANEITIKLFHQCPDCGNMCMEARDRYEWEK